MSALKYWLWLSAAEGLGPNAKAAVIREYGDPERAFMAADSELSNIKGLNAKDAEILEKRDISRVYEIEEACAGGNISIISMDDSSYPERLRNIYAPPPVIYVKGRIKDFDELPSVAVIGTRRASQYGLKMGRDIARQICVCGGTVISMLGPGIDTEAARGALLAGGKCIGVLGTAHEETHGSIINDIVSCGALVSEYAPGTKSYRSFFRDRNRIASGLSLGVVVVEAPEKSGTRLFASEAAEQGKEIFAVPGNADAPGCAGSNALIREGAGLVTCGADVMQEFEALFPEKIHITRIPAGPAAENPVRTDKNTDNSRIIQRKDIDNKKSRGYIDLREQLSALSAEQLEIITAIDKNSEHIDDIIENTGLPAAKVLSQLTLLEIKGYIKRKPGRRYILNTAEK